MDANGIKFRFIFYHIFSESPIVGSSFLYSCKIDQLKSLIQYNKQYRIILVFKAEHIPELHDIIIEHHIDEVFTLGNCTELNINDKKVTMINTTEKDLRFHILCEAIKYTREEEILQRQQKDHDLANVLATDILKLLDQVENLL